MCPTILPGFIVLFFEIGPGMWLKVRVPVCAWSRILTRSTGAPTATEIPPANIAATAVSK